MKFDSIGVAQAAASMKHFAGSDPTFVWGEWRKWWRDSQAHGSYLPVERYKGRIKPRANG